MAGQKITFNLFTKFALIISALLVVILFASGWFLISLEEEALLSQMMSSADRLTQFVSTNSASHIENVSYFALNDITNQLQSKNQAGVNASLEHADVLSVLIYNQEGKKLNPNGIETNQISIPEKYWLPKTMDCIYVPINGKDPKKVGNIQIIFSLQGIYQTINQLRWNLILSIVAILLVLNAAILMMMMLTINRPIKALTQSAYEVATGNFDGVILVKSSDEIGFLGASLSKMSKDLKQSFTQIEQQKKEILEHNEQLEERVKERTKELKNANEALYQKTEQLLEELEMAQRVQAGIIPDQYSLPDRYELNIGSKYLSMQSVGGDLFDVIRIGRNSYGFLMADVSGHGVPAALITTMAKVSFNSHAKLNLSASEICERVNRDIYNLISELDYYMTAYFGILDLETGLFEFANAGHHPAWLLKKSGEIERLDAHGFYIGIMDEAVYESKSVTLEKGDQILLFTDGIIEARNPNDDMYGYTNLKQFIKQHTYDNAHKFVEDLIHSVDGFCEGRPIEDDRAVLFFEFVSPIQSVNQSIQDAIKIEGIGIRSLGAEIEELSGLTLTQHELFEKALYAFKNKEYQIALEFLYSIQEEQPWNPSIYKNIGVVFYAMGSFRDSHEALLKAKHLDIDDIEIHKQLEIVRQKISVA